MKTRQPKIKPAVYDLRCMLDVRVPMRDGVTLSTDIYLPAAPGPFPAVLVRTPYDNSSAYYVDVVPRFTARGYAFVVQDCRGRYDSDGRFYAWHHEAADGFDTHEWIGAQPWSSGLIGTVGASYDGATQWQPAPLRSQYLKAMVPLHTPSDFWFEDEYVGGAFAHALNLHWCVTTSARTHQNADLYDWGQLFYSLPLIDSARAAGREIEFYRDWVVHSSYDDYWRQISTRDRYGEIDVPVLNVGGWFDAYAGAAIENFNGVRSKGYSEQSRARQKLIIGPWAHTETNETRVGEVEFGPDASFDLNEAELRWFDYCLKGIDNGVLDEPPIRIWVMGANVWRDEYEWPLARTRYTPYYLHSDGNAGRLGSDGTLTQDAPGGDEAPDSYVYDPMNPVPTVGGNHSMTPPVISVGPWDQRGVEARSDVLTFTTAVLSSPVEVTGTAVVRLYAQSSAPDTDFTAKLVDVHPDGRALNVTEGIIRARYRDSWERPSLMEPGRTYCFRIDLQPVSHAFLTGHRIRLDISSSNFPRFDRNPNTGHDPGIDDYVQTAEQQVHHSGDKPSQIVLPVIPAQNTG